MEILETYEPVQVLRASESVIDFELLNCPESVASGRVVVGEVRKDIESLRQSEWVTGVRLFESMLNWAWQERGKFRVVSRPGGRTLAGVYVPGCYFCGSDVIEPGVESVELSLRPASPLVIRVRNADGAPVEAASVVIRSAFDEESANLAAGDSLRVRLFRCEKETDDSGESVFASPLDGAMLVLVRDEKTGETGIMWGARAGDIVDVVLGATAKVDVHVASQAGTSIEGATVALFSGGIAGEDIQDIQMSDQDGVARVEGLARMLRPSVLVAHQDYAPEWTSLAALSETEPKSTYVTLRPAEPTLVRVVSEEGEPLEGLIVEFVYASGSWLPGHFVVQDDGIVRPAVRIARDEPLDVVLWAGQRRLGSCRIVVPAGAAECRVSFSGVARFREIRPSDELQVGIRGAELIGPRGLEQGVSEWSISGESPWVEEGDVQLVIYWEDGVVSEMVARAGRDAEVVATRQMGKVAFRGVDGLEAQSRILLLSPTGAVAAAFPIEEEPAVIDVATGFYVVRIVSQSDEQLAETAPFYVPAEGAVVDLRHSAESSMVVGTLQFEGGQGIGGASVQLLRSDGWYSGATITDVGGAFSFTGLASADYLIEANLEGVGGGTDRAFAQVSTRGGARVTPVSLVIHDSRQFELQVVGPPLRDAAAFLVGVGGVQVSRIGPGGIARFGTEGLPHLAGVVARDGKDLVIGVAHATSERRTPVDLGRARVHRLLIRDESGERVPGASVRVNLPEGPGVGPTAVVGAEGTLDIGVTGDPHGLRLSISGSGFSRRLVDLDEAIRAGEVELWSPRERQLLVVGSNGEPISSAVVEVLESGQLVQCDALGSCGAGGRLLVSAPGYWPERVTSGQSVVMLRRICRGVFIRLPGEGVSGVVVEGLFLGAPDPWNLAGGGGADGAEWVLGDVPEGSYLVTCLDEVGNRGETFTISVSD